MATRKKVKTEELSPDALIKVINSKMGEGTLRFASDPSLQIERLPTGILSIDCLMEGGFPRNRYVEIFGNASVGKTYTTLKYIATSQEMGLTCAFVDVEKTFDPEWASGIGVDLETLIYEEQEEHGQKIVDVMEGMVRSGAIDVLVMDSVAALLPKAEWESSAQDGSYGTQQAKLMSYALRKITAANKKTSIVFINQVRDKIGVVFGKRTITSGGRALSHYSGIRLEMVKTENVVKKSRVIDPKNGTETKKDIVRGHRVLVRVEKNKMQPVTEPVLTPEGWKPIGNVSEGEMVIGSDGSPVRVVGVYPQESTKVLKITFNDGSWTRCGPEHLWTTQRTQLGREQVLTTKEIAEQMGRTTRRLWRIPLMSAPAQLQKAPLPVDPYLLGVLLGDGNIRENGIRLSCAEPEILAEVEGRVPFGISVKKETGDNYDYRLTTGNIGGGRNSLITRLRELNLTGTKSHTKFIPQPYRDASVEDRILLLQGLMDTDGWVGRYENSCTVGIRLTSERLIRDVVDLVRSLGGTATTSSGKKWKVKGGEQRQVFSATICLPASICPFKLSRKMEAIIPRTKYFPTRIFKSIQKDADEESVCIRVKADDGLYVTRDYIVTHNTGGAKTYDQTTFVFDYDLGGADPTEDLIYLGRLTGLVHKKGDYWWVDGYQSERSHGRTRFRKYLRKNKAVAEELQEWILSGAEPDEA